MPQLNYLNAFRTTPSAQIDRAAHSNALLRNEVQRLPQRNAAEDQAYRANEQALTQNAQTFSAGQRKNAAGVAANYASAIANSADPMRAAQQVFNNPDFKAAVSVLGLKPEQFVFDPSADTADTLRSQASDFTRMMGGIASRLENTDIPSNVRVAEYYAGLPESGPGMTRETFAEANRAPTIRDIGGVPTQIGPGASTTPLSTRETEIDAAAERAGAEAWAKAEAAAGVARQGEQRSNERALAVWNAAKTGLDSAMKGTLTGPLVGLFPAMTSAQQIAEGSVAMVTPVLKQLFRAAGEGVFTDRDQDLLLEMVPTRTDHPEARAAKLQMIDAIVRAKLGADQQKTPTANAGADINSLLDKYAPR